MAPDIHVYIWFLTLDKILVIFTARNKVWGKVIFSEECVKNSVRGWYPSMHCRSPGPHPGGVEGSSLGGLQAHTQGGQVEGSGLGVSRPTPRAQTWWVLCTLLFSWTVSNPRVPQICILFFGSDFCLTQDWIKPTPVSMSDLYGNYSDDTSAK